MQSTIGGFKAQWIHETNNQVEWHQWFHPTYEAQRQTGKLMRESDGWRQAVAKVLATR
jgi:hypothetical protein